MIKSKLLLMISFLSLGFCCANFGLNNQSKEEKNSSSNNTDYESNQKINENYKFGPDGYWDSIDNDFVHDDDKSINFTIDIDNFAAQMYAPVYVGGSVNVYGSNYHGVGIENYYFGFTGEEALPKGLSYTPVCSGGAEKFDIYLYGITGTAEVLGSKFELSIKAINVWNKSVQDGGKFEIEICSVWYTRLFYNSNGGSNGPKDEYYDALFSSNQDKYVHTITDTCPTLNGYIFEGWSETKYQPGFGSPTYRKGDKFTTYFTTNKSNATRTLYAVWSSATWTIDIRFDSILKATNVPSNINGSTTCYSRPNNVAFKIENKKPVLEGYEFIGWSFTKYNIGKGIAQYKAGDSITLEYSNTGKIYILYAVYKIATYSYYSKLIYNSNGGTGGPSEDVSKIDQTDIPANRNVSISYYEPTRSGYTFKGWSTEIDGGTVYQPGDSVVVPYSINSLDSKVLYACWDKNIETFYSKLSYDANGGFGGPGNNFDVVNTKYKPSSRNIQISSEKPVKEGSVFKGWSSTKDGTVSYNTYDAIAVPYSLSSSDVITLYAVWDAVKYNFYSKLEFNANGGKNAPNDNNDYVCSDSQPASRKTKLSTIIPTRDGYDFMGWSDIKNGSVKFSAGDEITIPYSKSSLDAIRLYAVWSKRASNYYSVLNFDACGGEEAPTIDSEHVSALSSPESREVVIPTSTPKKDGYTFLGWSSIKNGPVEYESGSTIYVPYSSNEKTDLTLYAIWKKNKVSSNKNNLSNNPLAIFGIVMGSLFGVASVIVLTVVLIRRKKFSKKEKYYFKD